MSIVKEIVELLGGRLQMTSQPGQGSAVTLWLPLSATAAASADKPAVARSQWSLLN
jgi:signal transduction histidine kinase